MRVIKAVVTGTLACWLIGCPFSQAQPTQDDFDFDALLDDISSIPTSTQAKTAHPAQEVAQAQAQAPAAAAPEAVQDAPAEPAPDELDIDALMGMETPAEPAAETSTENSADSLDAEMPALEPEAPAEPASPATPEVSEAPPAPEEPPMPGEEAIAPAEEPPMPAEEALTPAEEPLMPAEEAAAPEEESEDVLKNLLGPEETPAIAEESPAQEAPEAAEAPEAEENEVVAAGRTPAAPAEAEEEAAAPAEETEAPLSAEAARLLSQQEEVRLQAKEKLALQDLQEGYRLLTEKKYAEAVKSFEKALTLPVRPKTESSLTQAKWGYAEANYQMASDLYAKKTNLPQALDYVNKALQKVPDHKPSLRLKPRLEYLMTQPAVPVPVKKREEYAAKQKSVKELYDEGRQYFEARDYDKAEKLFDQVLADDPYNEEAMRYLEKLNQIRYDLYTTEKEATAADMLQEVRDKWNPPIRGGTKDISQPQRTTVTPGLTESQMLQKKLESITIPLLEFRQANITDVINFLVEASIAGDPEKAGVNIILNLNIPGQETAMPAPVSAPASNDAFGGGDFFGEPAGTGAPSPAGGGANIPTITLNLRRVKLLDAIRYITEVAGLKYRLEGNAVIITPSGVAVGEVVTRLYPVQPSILDVIIEKQETEGGGGGGGAGGEFGGGEFGGRTSFKRGDVKDFFEKAGVPFPVGTSITYNPGISKLIVANTPENHDKLERVLAEINLTPSQVEIEARFVEVSQGDLEEMGLEWLLSDNYEIAHKTGNTPVGGTPRIQVDANADSGGFTRGIRFFNFDSTSGAQDPLSASTSTDVTVPVGNILSLSSVLTNPQLQIILHALSQKGRSDLLSAPRVTTRTGQSATIQVVQEIIYPTEFEQDITVIAGGNLPDRQVVTVTPGAFETRKIGVILNVTPTVGPDGYTIDLALAPEVAELVSWINYGSLFEGQTINIPQPIFASRNVTTTISIWDGQTVVMGGLIREDMVTVKDKIPLLGDIPFLGRLFRNEGQKSTKRNLIIFVTARLVRPDGRPLNVAETSTASGTTTATAGGGEGASK